MTIEAHVLLIIGPLILASLFLWWAMDYLGRYDRMRALYCGKPGDPHYDKLWRERKRKSRRLGLAGIALLFGVVVAVTFAWLMVVDWTIRPAVPVIERTGR